MRATAGGALALLAQSFERRNVGQLPRGRNAGDDRADDREQSGEGDDAAIEGDFTEARNVVRNERQRCMQREISQSHADNSTGEAKNHRFDEELLADTPGRRSECDTECDFPATVQGAREQQPARIRADNEQQRQHGRQQQEECWARVAGQIVLLRLNEDGGTEVIFYVGFCKAGLDGAQVSMRLLKGDARFEAAHDVRDAIVPLSAGRR